MIKFFDVNGGLVRSLTVAALYITFHVSSFAFFPYACREMYRRNLVFAAACLGMLLFGIVFLSLGSANNMLAERFHLDNNSVGTLTALLPFGILAGSLVFGPVVDRFGYKWMLVTSSLLVMAGLEGIALGKSRELIQLFVFLIGLGGGVLNGATNALAADVSEGERAAKLSLLGVFFGIGALGMPSALAALSDRYSLEAIIAGIGFLVLVPVLYFVAISFPPPKQRVQTGSLAARRRLLAHPVLLLACGAMAIQSGMEGMSNDWMTRYFKGVVLAGQKTEESKNLLALMVLTGALVGARLVLSKLLKQVRPGTVLFISIGLSAAGVLGLMAAPNYTAALCAALFIGAGLAAGFPVVLSHIGDLYPNQSGTAFSAIFFVALIGNMAINKTFGRIAAQYGINQYTKVMLVCLVGSGLLLALIFKLGWQPMPEEPHAADYALKASANERES